MTLTKARQDRLLTSARTAFNLLVQIRDIAVSVSKCAGLALAVVLLLALMSADPKTTHFGDFLAFIQNENGAFRPLVLLVTMVLWAFRVMCFGVPGLGKTGGAGEDR